jgi:RNA-directed DNA polymerase
LPWARESRELNEVTAIYRKGVYGVQRRRFMMRKWYSLIDKVYNMENLYGAFKAVKSNKGAPGVDGETIEDFEIKLKENIEKLHYELKTDTYYPKEVKRVYIDKPDGGKRPLGIPTVRDRVVQQALLNVLQPIFEPDFHPSSYGYRPGRSCQTAVAKAERFMNKYGLEYVVDMDLSKCFDTLDHELILKAVNQKVSDGKILKLIKSFLKSGIMEHGAFYETEKGSPQGGVFSPLLANIYLDYFDKKMMANNIRIVRYADDILVFARTKAEAGKYEAFAIGILENELRLKVNKDKTHITSVAEGVAFLGFIIRRKYISINPKRIKRLKDKIRKITPRNSGRNVGIMIQELNPILRGWANYFKVAKCKETFADIMRWLRRRLRMKKMREWKSWKALHKQLRRMGYKGDFEKISMTKWRNSASPLISMALPNKWFDELRLYDISKLQVGTLYRYYE